MTHMNMSTAVANKQHAIHQLSSCYHIGEPASSLQGDREVRGLQKAALCMKKLIKAMSLLLLA